MRTNITGFVLSIEKFITGTIAAAMSDDCMSVRLVDGYVVVGMTTLSTKERWMVGGGK